MSKKYRKAYAQIKHEWLESRDIIALHLKNTLSLPDVTDDTLRKLSSSLIAHLAVRNYIIKKIKV